MDVKKSGAESRNSGVGHETFRHQEMKPDHSVTGAGETSVSRAAAEQDSDYGADGSDLSIEGIQPNVENVESPDETPMRSDDLER